MSKPQDDLERLQQQQSRLNRVILGALLLILLVSLGIFLASRSKTPPPTPAGGKKTVYLSLSTAPLASPGTAPATSIPALPAAVTPAMSNATATVPATAATHSPATPPVPVRPVIPVAAAHSGAPNAAVAVSLPRKPVTGEKAAAPTRELPKAVARATHPQATAKATAQPAPANACKTAGWYVQLGAFGRVSATQPLVAKLQQQGFSACVATLPQNRLHRVLVGPLPSRFAASNVTARIAQLTGHQGYPQHWPGTQ